MALREETLSNVAHPDHLYGHQVVRLGQDLHDLADRVKNGSPTEGWEGDPRLTLAKYRDGKNDRYELWRLEADGQYRLVAKLPLHLDPGGVIRQLVARDARRGYDVRVSVDRHNARVQADKDRVSADRIEAARDKLAWALRRDLGERKHTYLTGRA